MKSNNFKITLEKPCVQNWDKMPRMPGGLFCGQCSKVVKDFTTMSDEELIATLTRKHDGGLCGVFSQAQLEKTYCVEPVPERRSHSAWKLLLAGLLSFELPIFAQAPFVKEKTAVTQNKEKKTYPRQPRYLKGKVSDRQTKAPVKVNVRLYTSRFESGHLLSTTTDSNGHYEIRLPQEGLEKFFRLVFSDSTFNERSIVVDRDKLPVQLNVTMVPLPKVEITTAELPEVTVILPVRELAHTYSHGGIPPSYDPIRIRRSPLLKVRIFFWKVFHPVKAIKRWKSMH